MAALTGLFIADSYKALLKTVDNDVLGAAAKEIVDGYGNVSGVLFDTSGNVTINGNFRALDAILDSSGSAGTAGQVLTTTGTTTQWQSLSSVSGVTGSGTAGYLPLWSTNSALTNSIALQSGSTITISGTLTATTKINTPTLQLTGGTGAQGTFSWNADEETVDLIQNGATLQLGQEVQIHCKNQTGALIPDGTPVYAAGTLGASGRILIAPMIANGSIQAKYFLGVTTEDIADGEDGKVTTFGKIRGLNTAAYTEGQTLWVSSTVAGAFQITRPIAPNLDLEVAIVINSSVNNGTIFVRANIGHYLGTAHDVNITSVAENDLLVYKTNRWVNTKSIGDLSAANVTLSGYLRGPATFVIDPAEHGDERGLVQILGDLRVDGTTTTINSTTISVSDKNITLAKDAVTAGDANGAGITIAGANATLTYLSATDDFTFNKSVNAVGFVGDLTGNVTGTVSTLSNHDTDDLDEGLTNLYFTTTRARDSFSAGTGVAINAGEISIGQSVGTTDNVTFGVVTASLSGNASTASALQTARNIALDGSVTGNADFDGSGNITITTTTNHNHDDRYYTETESDGKYLLNTTDTLDGDLTVTGQLSVTGTIDLSNADLNIGAADIIFDTVSGGAVRGLIWNVAGQGFLSKITSGGIDSGKVTIYTNIGTTTVGSTFEIYGANGLGLSLSNSGILTAGGGTSTQWNTAYNYSQVGHLPLTGKAADSELLDGIDSSRVVYGSGANKSTAFDYGNINTAIASGFYDGYDMVGAPTASTYYHLIHARHNNTANNFAMQLAGAFYSDTLYYRQITNNVASAWRTIIHSGNIGSQSVNYAAGAGNASTLDTLDSSQFLRSDESDTMTGSLTVNGSGVGITATSSQNTGLIVDGGTNSGKIAEFKYGTTKAVINTSGGGYFLSSIAIGATSSSARLTVANGTPNAALGVNPDTVVVIDSSANQYLEFRTSSESTGIMQGILFTDNGQNAFVGYKEYTGGTANTYGEALHFAYKDFSASDSNNGIYFGTSATPEDGVSNVQMFIKGNGKIGINSNEPTARLSVFADGVSPHSLPTGISVSAGTGGANLLARDTSFHNWFPYVDGSNYYSADAHTIRNSTHTTNFAIIEDQNTVFNGRISWSNATASIISNQLQSGYNYAGEDADFWINYTGYQGGTSYFRDFRVGNGKQGLIAFFDGSTARVGIGTTNTSGTYGKLTVDGSISLLGDQNTKLEIGRYSAGAPNSYIKLGPNSNSLRITNNTDTADILYLTNDGNLGLGVTPSNWAFFKAVQVNGGNSFVGYANQAEIWSNSYYDSTSRYYSNGFATRYVAIDGRFEWYQAPFGTAGNAITFTKAMTLNASGNLSIGNTNDTYKLDVEGDARIVGGLQMAYENSNLYAQNAALSYYSPTNGVYLNGAGTSGWLRLNAAGTENDINAINIYGAGAGGYIQLRTAGNTRLTVLNNGNIGINNTIPYRKLQVDGHVGVRNGSFFLGDESGSTNDGFQFYKSSNILRIYKDLGSFGGGGGAEGLNLDLYSGSAYATRISGNGNSYFGSGGGVGIGRTDVSFTLDVASVSNSDWATRFTNANSQSVYFAHGGGYGAYINAGSNASSGTYLLALISNGITRAYLKGNGYFGIGTGDAADFRLHVQQSSDEWAAAIGNVGAENITTYFSHGAGYGMAIDSTENDSKYIFKAMAGTGAGQGKGTIPVIYAQSNQLVGIGTDSPTTRLDVRGNMLIKGDSADGGILTITRRYSTGAQTINFNNNHPVTNEDWTGARIVSADAGNWNGYLAFQVSLGNNANAAAGTAAVATVMRLTKDRRVGIGVTFPDESLHVDGNIKGGYGIFNAEGLSQNLRVGGIYGSLGLYIPATYNMQFSLGWGGVFRFTQDNTTRFTISTSGTITATGDVLAYSDARVKENIETIDNALDKVMSMRGVSYNRTDNDDKTKKVGVIAQEIQKVLPEVVSEQEDGMLSVSYGNIVGVLIEAIKEQQKQIDELKSLLNVSPK